MQLYGIILGIALLATVLILSPFYVIYYIVKFINRLADYQNEY